MACGCVSSASMDDDDDEEEKSRSLENRIKNYELILLTFISFTKSLCMTTRGTNNQRHPPAQQTITSCCWPEREFFGGFVRWQIITRVRVVSFDFVLFFTKTLFVSLWLRWSPWDATGQQQQQRFEQLKRLVCDQSGGGWRIHNRNLAIHPVGLLVEQSRMEIDISRQPSPDGWTRTPKAEIQRDSPGRQSNETDDQGCLGARVERFLASDKSWTFPDDLTVEEVRNKYMNELIPLASVGLCSVAGTEGGIQRINARWMVCVIWLTNTDV